MTPKKLKALFAPAPPPQPHRPSPPAEAEPGLVCNRSGKGRLCQAWRRRSWVQRKILRQARAERIPVEKLIRAVVQRGVPEATARAYLAGEIGNPHLHWTIGDEFFLAISDICWAVALEQEQIENVRTRWYIVPYHPGVRGREGRLFGVSRECFLEFCLRSQPRLARPALKALRAKQERERRRRGVKVARPRALARIPAGW